MDRGLNLEGGGDLAECVVMNNAMHPGNAATSIGNNNGRIYRAMKKNLARPSAKALLYLASSGEIEGVPGKFFNLTTKERATFHARDTGAVMAVRNMSFELCGLS
jgi:retinol dehydrogenase 13